MMGGNGTRGLVDAMILAYAEPRCSMLLSSMIGT